MNKINKHIIAILLYGFLTACGSGSSSDSGSQSISDTQANKGTKYFNGSNASISFVANNCKIIAPNGTCSVNVTYSGDGIYSNQLQVSIPTGYTASNGCNNQTATANPQSCSFTITAGANTPAQTVGISIAPTTATTGATPISLSFTVGGSL